jgi:hypothetical protein
MRANAAIEASSVQRKTIAPLTLHCLGDLNELRHVDTPLAPVVDEQKIRWLLNSRIAEMRQSSDRRLSRSPNISDP